MLLLTKLSVVFMLSPILSPCSAQAPGDEDADCTGAEDAPTYPDTVKNLMDSHNYLQLLPGNGTGNTPIQNAVWNDRSVDGNDVIDSTTKVSTYWQQRLGICRIQARVCGWKQNGVVVAQDNWLFTQHINQDFDPSIYNYPVEIRVEITYALQDCRTRHGCQQRFTLHNYMINAIQLPSIEGSGYMNTNNYQQFAEITPTDQMTHTETFTITLGSSDTGFYIAIRDTGTCVGISRLRVYRNKCRSFQSGLVLYPDAPAPVSGSENINFNCVNNAEVSGNPHVTCGSDGTWGPANPACVCSLGYEERQTECIICPAGQYRSDNDVTCQQCPGNTKTEQVAAPLCECLDGYFRNDEQRGTNVPLPDWITTLIDPNEQPRDGCTQPPSAPDDVVLEPQQTSITIRWLSPAQTGGRSDLYYRVEHSDPDNLGSFTGTVYKSGGSTSHTFTGLRPYTQYCIRVSAHNGVSDQDPDGDHRRIVEKCNRTMEGSSGTVGDLQCVYPVVLWQAPAEPNGIILDYRLIFTKDGAETETDTTQSYFIITGGTLPGDSDETGSFIVQVRARNAAGLGEFSCKLTCDPESKSIKPQSCLFCPEQRVGLVDYPSTTAPETGTLTVTTKCVENAVESSQNLSVTCDSSGNWGNETPRCQCREGYTKENQNGIEICSGPPTEPPKCPTCPEDITAAVNRIDIFILWKPVSGALQYRLRFRENNEKKVIFRNETVDRPIFKAKLSDFKVKVFSVEIAAAFHANEVIVYYSEPIEVNTQDFADLIAESGGTSTEDTDNDPLIIAVVVTFIGTALVVSFLAIMIGMVMNAQKKRKAEYKGHSNGEFPMKGDLHT